MDALDALDLSCRSILVVDDDPDVRDAIASVLGDEGYQVTSAGNGREALEQLRKRTRPSLILLDMVMPDMDGWNFRMELKKQPELAAIPVVILSAHGNVRDAALALGAVRLPPQAPARREPARDRRALLPPRVSELSSGP